MDKEKLFKLFDENEQLNDEDILSRNDILNIGMFIKIINNHKIFHKKLETFFKNEVDEYDVTLTEKVSKSTVYQRSWHYISNINLNNIIYNKILINFDYTSFYNALTLAIKFFEEIEEYEKCSFLFKIQKALKSSLEI